MAYVNIKTFDHTTADGEVKGTEVSVAFKVYSDSERIKIKDSSGSPFMLYWEQYIIPTN